MPSNQQQYVKDSCSPYGMIVFKKLNKFVLKSKIIEIQENFMRQEKR